MIPQPKITIPTRIKSLQTITALKRETRIITLRTHKRLLPRMMKSQIKKIKRCLKMKTRKLGAPTTAKKNIKKKRKFKK